MYITLRCASRGLPVLAGIRVSWRRWSGANTLKDSYRVPAEWEPHAACVMGWPFTSEVWPERAVPARQAFTSVVQAISRSEKVILLVRQTELDRCRRVLRKEIAENRVELCDAVLYNDVWTRDAGPTFVISDDGKRVRGVDWTFNCWGGQRYDCGHMKELARALCKKLGLAFSSTSLVCEGGALAFDGAGTVVTTESVLLSSTRNGCNKQEVERKLSECLGGVKVIWLPEGVYADSTDGHVDNLLAFVGPAEVVLCWTDDHSDPQFSISRQAEQVLLNATDAKGRRFKIHRLHQADPLYFVYKQENQRERKFVSKEEAEQIGKEVMRVTASYINFYIANKSVIVPQFDQLMWDQAALVLLGKLFRGREMVGIDARPIVIGSGGIHCITQQLPATTSQLST